MGVVNRLNNDFALQLWLSDSMLIMVVGAGVKETLRLFGGSEVD